MKKEKYELKEESYRDLIYQIPTTKPGKDSRILHKKLKRYGKDCGLLFESRYPNFSFYISIIAIILSIFSSVLNFLK